MMLHGVHALLDQEYTGDINIVPNFRIANPLRLLSHLDEEELTLLIREGERSAYSRVEAIRRCTMISRTLEEILYRFEYGDLRPDPTKFRRQRSSRRRPPPTAEQFEQLRQDAAALKVTQANAKRTKGKASAKRKAVPAAAKKPRVAKVARLH